MSSVPTLLTWIGGRIEFFAAIDHDILAYLVSAGVSAFDAKAIGLFSWKRAAP